MEINKPLLPIVEGYTEVIRDGEHVYKNIKTEEIVEGTPEPIVDGSDGESTNYDDLVQKLVDAYKEGVNEA